MFTGAVSYLGNPIFFKENCMERVCAADSGIASIQHRVQRRAGGQ